MRSSSFGFVPLVLFFTTCVLFGMVTSAHAVEKSHSCGDDPITQSVFERLLKVHPGGRRGEGTGDLSGRSSTRWTISEMAVLRCLSSDHELPSAVRRTARGALRSVIGKGACDKLVEPLTDAGGGWTRMERIEAMSALPLCVGLSRAFPYLFVWAMLGDRDAMEAWRILLTPRYWSVR